MKFRIQILFQGLKAGVSQIITIVMAFLVICVGITILQMSKVDPTELKTLDRRSTILLQAARKQTESIEEKSLAGVEDPGMDALRGSFGTVGSIIRARSAHRMSQSSARASSVRSSRFGGLPTSRFDADRTLPPTPSSRVEALPSGLKRHQLFDPPVPTHSFSFDLDHRDSDVFSLTSQPGRKQTIKFDEQDTVHQYHPPGTGDDSATHEHRLALHAPLSPGRSVSIMADNGSIASTPSTSTGNSTIGSAVSPPGLPSAQRQSEADVEMHGLRTAPPRLGLGNLSGGPRSGAGLPPSGLGLSSYVDPFEGSPSTTTLASFPSASSTASAAAMYDSERARIVGHGRFGRASGSVSSRDYPRAGRAEDAEEREMLWGRRSESEEELVGDVEGEREGESDERDQPSPPPGAIRLVSSVSRPPRF